jgi:hypothetical protein
MKFRFEHLTLTQLGEVFGVSSHQIGNWLVTLGLRSDQKRPSREAFAGGYVTTAPSRGQGYNYVWHAEKTVKALVDAGRPVAVPPGCALLAPCVLHGPFVCRPHAAIGSEIVNGDGTVAVWVTGEENAAFLCRVLNAADRHGVVARALHGGANAGGSGVAEGPAA